MSFHIVRRIVTSAATLTLLVIFAMVSGPSTEATGPTQPSTLAKRPAVTRVPAPTPQADPAPPPRDASDSDAPPDSAPAAAVAPTEVGSPAPPPAPSPTPPPAPAPSPTPTAEKAEEKERKAATAEPEQIDTPPRSLYVAVGHGRAPNGRLQLGTINPRTGQKEIDAAALIVESMTEVLERAPNIQLWAEKGRDHPNLVGTVARANRRGVQDCIEIHQDWYKAPPGAFAHWYPGSKAARALANDLVKGLQKEGLDTRTRWHKPRPELYFLRETKCRAVLVEVGRVGDFTNSELRAYGRALAEAYIRSIRER